MLNDDIKIGQSVTLSAQEDAATYIILDRHPDGGWWLQDAETGNVGRHLHARAGEILLKGDPYRETEVTWYRDNSGDLVSAPVQQRSGCYLVVRHRLSGHWRVLVERDGRVLHITDVKGRARAGSMAAAFARLRLEPSVEELIGVLQSYGVTSTQWY